MTPTVIVPPHFPQALLIWSPCYRIGCNRVCHLQQLRVSEDVPNVGFGSKADVATFSHARAVVLLNGTHIIEHTRAIVIPRVRQKSVHTCPIEFSKLADLGNLPG